MAAMITLLVGHRGAGKTTYLNSLIEQGCEDCFDLDAEIERLQGKTIAELFKLGEVRFRQIERQTLDTLIIEKNKNLIVALGAGFEGPLPARAKVVWIRRESDAAGRVFLNRPRLQPEVSPFQEYMERFEIRQKRFSEWSHEQLMLPEGYVNGLEDFVIERGEMSAPFDLTVMPESFRDWPTFWGKRRKWNVRRWELRDDLLSKDQIQLALNTIPNEKIIYSHRYSSQRLDIPLQIDWALELGRPAKRAHVLSLHKRSNDLAATLRSFEEFSEHGEILKISVEIDNFSEIRIGHEWWLEDPAKRAFLPRSKNGRWRWYRSLFGARMPVHFFREGDGSSADQPLFWQLRLQPDLKKKFAAVLGHPVAHSLSPLEHQNFFSERQMPFVAIDVSESEFAEAWPILKELGLSHVAVTAPLKLNAFELCNEWSREARTLKSVNTLFVQRDSVFGHNTDFLALKKIKNEQPRSASVWIWGGGGIISSVRAVWPEVFEVRARMGTDRTDSPDLLIWATGRSREFKVPSAAIRPRLVMDLNYSADSPAMEWAVSQNLPYQSGLRMFKLQAEFQREFWKGHE